MQGNIDLFLKQNTSFPSFVIAISSLTINRGRNIINRRNTTMMDPNTLASVLIQNGEMVHNKIINIFISIIFFYFIIFWNTNFLIYYKFLLNKYFIYFFDFPLLFLIVFDIFWNSFSSISPLYSSSLAYLFFKLSKFSP